MWNKRLKLVRKTLKMTVEDFATELNISKHTLGAYERGEITPSIKFASSLCELLKININWFLTGQGEMFIQDKNSFKRVKADDLYERAESFGKRLASIQEFHGLLNSEMAKLLKISEKRYRRLVLCREYPTIPELNALKSNFVVDADWLLYGNDNAVKSDDSPAPVVMPQLTPEQYQKLLKLIND